MNVGYSALRGRARQGLRIACGRAPTRSPRARHRALRRDAPHPPGEHAVARGRAPRSSFRRSAARSTGEPFFVARDLLALGSSGMATVAEVMNKSVLTVDPTASIGEAAEKMIEAGVGAVVVMEDMARIVGIVTERDLMRAVAQRARAAEATRAPVDDRERRHDRAGHGDPRRREDDVRAELPPSPRREQAKAGSWGSRASAASRSTSSSRRSSRPASARRLRAVIRLFPNAGGWLEVVCGPMFSGKSEELIRRLRRAEIAGQRVLIVKPKIDSRYDIGHVVSHAGAKMRAVAVEFAGRHPGPRRGLRRHRRRRGAVLRAGDRAHPRRPRREGDARPRAPASTRTSAAPRSARCRSCSAARSSSTSCRRSATAAAARRR